MRRKQFLLLLLCALLPLSGCSVLELKGEAVTASPPLQLLTMPAYEDEELASSASPFTDDYLRVDLWLDASQLMGGVNASKESLYPHYSRKYREGGFHYRFGQTAGWYEAVLQSMLAAAGDARVRLLRAGNERLPDQFLWSSGFTFNEPDALRSLRRDMLTYAINPMPDIFASFSAEDMKDSFYTLGSPQLNQMQRFIADDGAELENPGMTAQMSAALDRQIAVFAEEAAGAELNAVGSDQDSPLMYALDNIDLNRLSVITCDPATLRRLNGTATDGAPVNYIAQALQARGVFDAGLKVGLYAMQLDYMGQMTSFGSADFSDPLLWGRLLYNNKTNRADAALPMPRILLTLVIGALAQVDGYTAALNLCLNENAALRGLRGPQDDELSYTANGQTILQQPFSFAYHYTSIARPTMGFYTQHTAGMTLSLPPEEGAVAKRDGFNTITLAQTQSETVDCLLSWPAATLDDGMSLDLSTVNGAQVEVIDSLLMTGTLPNAPSAQAPSGVQAITLRDTLYLFAQKEKPFADAPEQNPFSLSSLSLSADQASVQAAIRINRPLLSPGYYRLRVTAAVAGDQLSWPTVSWAEAAGGLNVDITNGQISAWESFTNALTRYARKPSNIPRQFYHAWGSYAEKPYYGVSIPDFPPVYKAPHLSRLLAQLREAANVDTVPYIQCVFDVFVPNP